MSRPFDLIETPLEPGTTLIEASAGTGKTYCLTGIVLRLLLERRVARPDELLVMTFTNAATQELVERIRAQIRAAVDVFSKPAAARSEVESLLARLAAVHGEGGLRVLQDALLEIDTIEVCTIHGFCRRVLEQHAFECGIAFDAQYITDDSDLIQAAAEDFWRRTIYPSDPLLAAVVAHNRWSPGSFIVDYETWRRHLDAELRPKPLRLADATAGLRAACEAARAAWNRAEAEPLLRGVNYTKDASFTTDTMATWLDRVDAFCRDDDDGQLSALLGLSRSELNHSVYKRHHPRLEPLAFPDLCEGVAAAVHAVELALRGAFLDQIGEILGQVKRRSGAQGFDDLVGGLHAALNDPARGPPLARALRSRFAAVLVDEFQDTDERQYDIFRRIFSDRHLFFVGDPKQAIYGFRGADVFAYMRAKDEADRVYSLHVNHRSVGPLVDGVNATFSSATRPFVYDAIPFEPASAARGASDACLQGDEGPPLRWLWLGSTNTKEDANQRSEKGVVSEIARLLSSGATLNGEPLSTRAIAILVRSNDQAVGLQRALRTAGVPAVVGQEESIFDSEEIAELHALVDAVVQPGNESVVRAALASRTWGLTAEEILNLDAEAWQTLTEELDSMRELWRRRGFVAMSHAFIAAHAVRERLLAGPGGARSLTNLLHIIDVVHQATIELHLSPETTPAWLARMRAAPELLDRDALELRLESDDDAVQILTVHKSKGLEYPVVFCPHLWDARSEEKKPTLLVHLDGRPVYDFDDRSRALEVVAAAREEAISENARLAYVAMTRARERCYVAWGEIGSTKDVPSPLAYLLGQPESATGPDTASDAMNAALANTAAWRARLERSCAAKPHAAAVYDACMDTAPRWHSGPSRQTELHASVVPARVRDQLRTWRLTSFSSLAGEVPSLRAGLSQQGLQVESPDHADPPAQGAGEAPLPGLFAFARGARAGTCLHEVLERIDFTRVDAPETRAIIEVTLQRHGLSEAWQHGQVSFDPLDATLAMLRALTCSPLPNDGLRLAQVDRAHRLSEWQFYTPVSGISPSAVGEILERHGHGLLASGYAPSLRVRSGQNTNGFLNGFVDLVFEHEGRWYLIDWKSNHLGHRPADYDHAALWRAMCTHDYVLQYHLYVLGLHRYLRHRLKRYQYSRDFGGVYYGFLRGIEPTSERGWYVDRPSIDLVEALDGAIGQPVAA